MNPVQHHAAQRQPLYAYAYVGSSYASVLGSRSSSCSR